MTKSTLSKNLLSGASKAARLLTEMKVLHAQKAHILSEAVCLSILECIKHEAKYRSAFDVFEEKRNADELLETVQEFNAKLFRCVLELKKL